MSKENKDVIVMSKRKFYIFLGGIIFVSTVVNGIVSQALERLF